MVCKDKFDSRVKLTLSSALCLSFVCYITETLTSMLHMQCYILLFS